MSEARSQQDLNQVYSLLAVRGSFGTADTQGTAGVVPVGANPATGALYTHSLSDGFSIPSYDYISFSYSGGTVSQITYYQGGTAGTVVGSLNFNYSGGTLLSISK